MIVFRRELVKEMEEHALRASPKEACGILAGRTKDKKIVERVYKCRNISRRPESRYIIDAGEMLQVLKDIEARKLELLGFYHSHPFPLAHPSDVDKEEAMWPGHSYVIVSVSNKSISSWLWDEKKFVEEEVGYD